MVGKGRQVTIQFLGDAKGLVSAANMAGRSTTTLGDKLKRVGKAALIGFAGAATIAAKAAYEFTEAAIDDQKSQVLMANQLRNTTNATNKQIASVEDWITVQGQLLGVTDDELRPAISKMAAATGDLDKSQRLVSLAMDVAAGRGKTLQQVTDALARAQTGSLTGLGRLGVATKDAAGNTKTLAEITDDLTKKYAGAASAAADTAAGKYQRLKVAFSETAENIGYKLLPYANEFGDWMLKEGVPAVEHLAGSTKKELGPVLRDLAGWVKDNKDDLHDLGTEILDTAIPAVRDIAGFAGDAVEWFSKLPGPVKESGAEIAIAAAIVPKFSSALTGMNTALGLGTGKLTGWRKGLLLAAGVGGVAAITKGAKDGNREVSLLGDALTGAFVGGTVGSAIPIIGTGIGAVAGAATGAAVGLIQMHKATDKAADSASDAKPDVQGLADTLNQLTGATTKSTRAWVLDTLEKSKATDAAATLGLTNRDLVNSVMGNKVAYDKVREAVEKATRSSVQIMGANGQVTRSNQKAYDAAGLLTQQIDGLGDSLVETKKKTRDTAIASEDLTSVYKNFPKTVATQIDAEGIVPTARGVADLAVKYDKIDKRHIKALIQATGVDISITQVEHLISDISKVKDKTVTITVKTNHIGGVSGGGGHTAPGVNPRDSGRTSADFGRLFDEDYQRRLEQSGMGLVVSIARGLKKGERTLKNVLKGLEDYIKTKNDKLQELLDSRNSFADSFRSSFSDSVFGAQFTDAEGNQVPPTVQKMLDFAKQQQANAHTLAANVGSLIKRGLSKDLLSQLASQGQSGYDQIAALATASDAELQVLNQTNQDTKNTLDSLGEDLFNAINPDQKAQIDLLTQQVASATKQEQHLRKIANSLDKGEDITIKGTDLVITLHKLTQATGTKYLVN